MVRTLRSWGLRVTLQHTTGTEQLLSCVPFWFVDVTPSSDNAQDIYQSLKKYAEIADLHGTWDILTVWTNVTIFDSSDKM